VESQILYNFFSGAFSRIPSYNTLMNSKLRKIVISTIFLIFAGAGSLFAEKLSLKTGDIFGFSQTDYFQPLDRSFMMTSSTVSSIGKVENGIWCLKVTVKKSLDSGVPVIFEYFVREGDVIQVKRFLHNEEVYKLKVFSVNWNEITFDVL